MDLMLQLQVVIIQRDGWYMNLQQTRLERS